MQGLTLLSSTAVSFMLSLFYVVHHDEFVEFPWENDTAEWTNRTFPFARRSYAAQELWEDQCVQLCNDIKQTKAISSADEKLRYLRRASNTPAINLKQSDSCCDRCERGTFASKFDRQSNKFGQYLEEAFVNDASQLARAYNDKNCTFLGQTFKDGDRWETNTCESCTCSRGRVNCEPIICSTSNISPVSNIKIPRSKCCFTYDQNKNDCTVFESSRFFIISFGNRPYWIISLGTAQPSTSCNGDSFNVRLNNNYGTSNSSIMKIGSSVKLRIKVDLQPTPGYVAFFLSLMLSMAFLQILKRLIELHRRYLSSE